MDVRAVALLAGSVSTTIFVISYLPMLVRAARTRDLRSYSRPSLVLANVGNVVQACYVISLPVGPLWFLHGFYLFSSAVMLGLHLRHGSPSSGLRRVTEDVRPPQPADDSRRRPPPSTSEATRSTR